MCGATSLMLLLLVGPLSARAQEYIVRIDSLDLIRELDGRQEELRGIEQLNLNHEPETIGESIEVKVRTGERFYGKAIRGPRVFKIRGRLKHSEVHDHITLEIEIADYIRTGELVQGPDGLMIEQTVGQRVHTAISLSVGEPLLLGQMQSISLTEASIPKRLKCHDFWAVVDLAVRSGNDRRD